MDAFSYLAVLLSIILGLAVAQILTGMRGRMLSRATIRRFWPSDLLAIVFLLVLSQTWWAMFDLRNRETWTFVAFFVLLLQTILIYLQTGLIYPDFPPTQPVDLHAHYFAQRRHLFSLAIASTLVSISRDLVLNHALPHPMNLAFHLAYIALAITGLLSASERLHKALVVTMAAAFVSYVTLLFTRLP
ncbi:MAG: hypothetical protein V7609_3109 [Verrucomicrobiota bacterium]